MHNAYLQKLIEVVQRCLNLLSPNHIKASTDTVRILVLKNAKIIVIR